MNLLAPGYLQRDDGVIEINPDLVYPKLMAELGISEPQLDQFWLGVIYKCAILDAERMVQGNEHDKRNQGISLQVHIQPGRAKQRWQLKRYAPGKGEELAVRGSPGKPSQGRRIFEKLLAKRQASQPAPT